jgi:hypothetical protein
MLVCLGVDEVIPQRFVAIPEPLHYAPASIAGKGEDALADQGLTGFGAMGQARENIVPDGCFGLEELDMLRYVDVKGSCKCSLGGRNLGQNVLVDVGFVFERSIWEPVSSLQSEG